MSLFSKLSAAGYVALFRLLARRHPLKKQPIVLGASSRVLVFTCAGIGDTLTDSVVIKAMRETYPQLHIGAIVHRRRRLLLDHNPYVNQIYDFRKGPGAFYRLYRRLKADGPWDAIIHLRGNDPEPRCLSFLLNPDATVSMENMTQLSWLCGHSLYNADWDTTHGVEQTLGLARYLGADTMEPHLVYKVKSEDTQRLESKLSRLFEVYHFDANTPRLVLQIGGGRRASWRDWPVARFAELIAKLHQEKNRGLEIFVLGGSDQTRREQELAGEVIRQCGKLTYRNVVGKLSLAESAALLVSARALISTDTGIMHLGFAVGTRVVALIHCNNPTGRVGPYGYGDRHRVVQLPRPAGYRTPADANMSDLTADQVLKALTEVGCP